MLLPSKHLRISESLIGLGGYLLLLINENPRTIDELWKELNRAKNYELKGTYHTFDSLVLAIDFLYMIGIISINQEDKLYNATSEIGSK